MSRMPAEECQGSAIQSHEPRATPLKRVFIIGCVRSGTTWMMWLLAHHPETVVAQQPGTFGQLQKLRDWLFTESKVAKGLIAMSNGSMGKQNGFIRVDLKDVLEPKSFDAFSRALQHDIFQRIASVNPRARIVVDQTPEYIGLTDSILNVFPDAYFIHVIRDPRDVAISAQNAIESWGAGFPAGPVAMARHWRLCIEWGRILGAKTERYREVRYEDLLRDGARILQGIHEWLDLPTDAQRCEAAVRACQIDKLRQKAPSPAGFFRKGVAGAWREELSTSQVKAIEHIAGDLMQTAGYKPAFPRSRGLPLKVRLHEAGCRAGRSAARVIRHMLA